MHWSGEVVAIATHVLGCSGGGRVVRRGNENRDSHVLSRGSDAGGEEGEEREDRGGAHCRLSWGWVVVGGVVFSRVVVAVERRA